MKHFAYILSLMFVLALQYGRAQSTYNVPSSSHQTVHTCDAWIYDPGGANGNYSNDCNGYLVIYPAQGGYVSITSGTYNTEQDWDYAKIYNGVGTGGQVLTTLTGSNMNLTNAITSSDATGALTVLFHSDGSITRSGFALRVQCVMPVAMSDTTLTGCAFSWTDPGGTGNYSNNLDVTQTICSQNNERLSVDFSSLSLANGDFLYVYDGSSTTAAQIGVYSGTSLPGNIISTGSCLTFRFTSNASGVSSGWNAAISCLTCNPVSTASGSPCAFDNIHPFCTDEGQYVYESGDSGSSMSFFGSSAVGCLGSTPAPAWYFMRIDQPGNLTIHIQQHSIYSTSYGLDVDFACWGPFSASSSSAFVENLCCGFYNYHILSHPNNTAFGADYPYGNLVDCSYDPAPTEYCHINNAQTGEYYLLLITNFSRIEGVITFNSTSNSTATTDCSIMAAVSNTGPYCAGDTAQLICNNPQAGATYSWTGPNGWTSTQVNPIIAPITADMDGYTYGLVKSMNGENSDTAYTTIHTMSINTSITAPSDAICAGQSVTLSGVCDFISSVPVSGTCTNTWLPGGQHTNNVSVSPMVTTTYVLQQTYGNCLGRDSVTITVQDFTTQIFASDTEICRGDTVTLWTTCPEESSSCSNQWMPGNQHNDTVRVTPATTSSFILQQTVGGCIGQDTIQVLVNQPDINLDTIFVRVARDSLPYLFQNHSFYNVGTYSIHLTNSQGCDSLITLVLRYLDTIFVNLDTTVCPDQFPFLWHGVNFTGDSVATLSLIASNGADSVVRMTVNHYPNPILSLQVAEEACAGDTLPISIGVASDASLVISQNAAIQSGSQMIFIPDGISCPPHGTYYRSIANFSQFLPGAVMTSVNDLLYVRLKMEHSALEDLKLSLVCPNGSRSKLVADYDNLSGTWGNITNNYFRINLGLANRLTDVVSCDSSQNPIGEPWNYIWSNNTNHNYQYAAGTYGYCYEAVNWQSYANPYWDYNGSYTYESNTTHKSVKPSDPVNMTQIYHPYQSFSNLIGCPLNGTWYVEVQDMIEEDNGYLTEWELAFAPSLLQTLTPNVISKRLIGPWVTTLTDSTFIITPPVNLANDTTVQYRLVLQSDAGCTFDTTVNVTFHPNRIDTLELTICDTELPYTWEGQVFTASEERTIHLQTAHGCDSTLILRLTVSASSASVDEVHSCGSYTWQDGITYSASTNEPTVTLTNAAGCDSIVTLHLTINDEVETVDEVFECDSFVWIDGNTYYESTNDPVHVITMETGCDSIVHLHLTLGRSAASDTTAEACGIYSWYEHKNILNSCENLTHVFATPTGCDSTVTLHLTIFPIPEVCFNYYTLDDSYEVESVLHFEECSPDMVNYHWNMGNSDEFEDPAFDYIYHSAGTYRVTLRVTDENGCSAEKQHIVVIKNPEMQIYIPSSFTPNQDGLNDVLKPAGLYITDENYLFVIHNRWGEVVFKTTDPEQGWDGTYKGALVPNNSVMSYTFRCSSEKGMVRKKGVVVVMY